MWGNLAGRVADMAKEADLGTKLRDIGDLVAPPPQQDEDSESEYEEIWVEEDEEDEEEEEENDEEDDTPMGKGLVTGFLSRFVEQPTTPPKQMEYPQQNDDGQEEEKEHEDGEEEFDFQAPAKPTLISKRFDRKPLPIRKSQLLTGGNKTMERTSSSRSSLSQMSTQSLEGPEDVPPSNEGKDEVEEEKTTITSATTRMTGKTPEQVSNGGNRPQTSKLWIPQTTKTKTNKKPLPPSSLQGKKLVLPKSGGGTMNGSSLKTNSSAPVPSSPSGAVRKSKLVVPTQISSPTLSSTPKSPSPLAATASVPADAPKLVVPIQPKTTVAAAQPAETEPAAPPPKGDSVASSLSEVSSTVTNKQPASPARKKVQRKSPSVIKNSKAPSPLLAKKSTTANYDFSGQQQQQEMSLGHAPLTFETISAQDLLTAPDWKANAEVGDNNTGTKTSRMDEPTAEEMAMVDSVVKDYLKPNVAAAATDATEPEARIEPEPMSESVTTHIDESLAPPEAEPMGPNTDGEEEEEEEEMEAPTTIDTKEPTVGAIVEESPQPSVLVRPDKPALTVEEEEEEEEPPQPVEPEPAPQPEPAIEQEEESQPVPSPNPREEPKLPESVTEPVSEVQPDPKPLPVPAPATVDIVAQTTPAMPPPQPEVDPVLVKEKDATIGELQQQLEEMRSQVEQRESQIVSLQMDAAKRMDEEEEWRQQHVLMIKQEQAAMLEANAEAVTAELRQEMEQLQKVHEQESQTLRDELGETKMEAKRQLKQTQIQLEDAHAQLAALQQDRASSLSELEQQATKRQQKALTAQRQAEEKLAETMAVLDDKNTELQGLKTTMKELKSGFKRAEKQLKDYAEEIAHLREENETLEHNWQVTEDENEELKKQLEHFGSQEQVVDELKMEIRKLEDARDREYAAKQSVAENAESSKAQLEADRDAAFAQARDLEQQLNAALADVQVAKSDTERIMLGNTNLNKALESFQSERDAEIALLDEQRAAAEEALKATHAAALQATNLAHEHKVREIRLETETAVRQAVEKVSQLETQVVDLKTEKSQTRRSLDEAIRRLQASQEDVVDRSLMKNVLLDWFSKSGKSKKDVLEVMANLLHFSEEEKERCHVYDGSALQNVVHAVAAPLPTPRADVKNLEGENVRDKFISFLMAETDD